MADLTSNMGQRETFCCTSVFSYRVFLTSYVGVLFTLRWCFCLFGQVYMAGLCVVLLLYFVLTSLALATWAQLSDGFEQDQTTGIACAVSFFHLVC